MVDTWLSLTPVVLPLTLMLKVQLLPFGITPPVKLTEVPPAAAVMAPPPGQLVNVNALGVSTTKPAGRLSVNARPVIDVPASPLLAVKVNVKLVVPFKGINGEPNALVNASEGLGSARGTRTVLSGVVAVVPPSTPVALAVF